MKTILQVEHDIQGVTSLRTAMRNARVENPIQVAQDGQQAIDYLKGAGKFTDRQLFPLPCLVLLNLNLPHVTGLDVLKWIHEQPGLGTIVLILTDSCGETDIANAYRLGANAFLIKPSDAKKFEVLVKSIKDFWLNQNTLPQEPSPESPMEGVVSLVRTPAVSRGAKPSSPIGGRLRKAHAVRPKRRRALL